MKASEIFGLIVRVIGLIFTLIGAGKVFTPLLYLVGVYGGSAIQLLYGIPMLVIGVWFLRGAPKLVRFSYPEKT